MKIAISTSGDDMSAPVDRRFGRAAAFLIYDTDNQDFECVENSQNLNAAQGAGIQAAQHVVKSGAEALISGHCGPKAFKVLSAGNVKTFAVADMSVSEAVEMLSAGQLEALADADVEGHWV